MSTRRAVAEPPVQTSSLATTVAHALVVIGLVLVVVLLVAIRDALLLAFVSIIIATVLESMAAPLRRYTGATHAVALIVVALAVVALIAGVAWLVGAQVHAQILVLIDTLPAAVHSVEERFGVSLESLFGGDGAILAWVRDAALPSIASFGQVVANVLAMAGLAVAAGVFIAAQPELYRRGLIKLFPKSQHARVAHALDGAGAALRQWLFAQGIAMLAVGVMAGFGSWLLGLPAPVAIGLLAGLFEFVPLIGPVAGALPALILALSESTPTLLWTVALFVGIQQIEGNLITPIAQQRTARIPAALVLISVVACASLFGVLGALVAAPLAVVVLTLVQRLYVKETLHE